MIFNVSINQFRAVELNLTLIEAFVLHGVITLCGRNGIEFLHRNEKIYYWLSKNLLAQQMPLLKFKPDTIYRTMKDLRDKGFIEMLESKSINEYYRVTPLGESIVMLGQPSDPTDKNPTVGQKSEYSDGIGGKNGQNTLKGSDENPTIIVYTNTNKETPQNLENFAALSQNENNNKKSSKISKKSATFALEQYKPNCTTEIWEQVVKPAIAYRLQLLDEATDAKTRNGYKMTDRVAKQYETVAAQLVEKHGLAKVENYIKHATLNNVRWISLLSTNSWIEEKILDYSRNMQQPTTANAEFEESVVQDNNGNTTRFKPQIVKEMYEKLTALCTESLPKATPLNVEQFKSYFFGDIAKRAIYKTASFRSYTFLIKKAIETKNAQTKGFYNGTIAALIDEMIANQ